MCRGQSRDGCVWLFYNVRLSFVNEPFHFGPLLKKLISFVLKIKVYFSSISFVFVLDERSVKSFLNKKKLSFENFVCTVKNYQIVKIGRKIKNCSFFHVFLKNDCFSYLWNSFVHRFFLKYFVTKTKREKKH